MKMKSFFISFLAILFLIAFYSKRKKSVRKIYVAPDGSNQNSGTSVEEPLATINEAVKRIIRASDDSIPNNEVILRGGDYFVEKPVRINSAKFKKLKKGFSLTFKPYMDEHVIISGGKRISGIWKQKKPKIWVNSVREKFNQLFHKNERLTRARWPNIGNYLHPQKIDRKQKKIIFSDSISTNFRIKPKTSTELCATGQWHFIRQLIANFNLENHSLTTVTAIGPQLSSRKVQSFDRIYLENNIHFLNSEGEWYLNTKMDSLYLYTNTNPNYSKYFIPVTESLFILEGTKDHPLKNISFEDLTFQYTSWKFPKIERKGVQAGFWGTKKNKPVYSPPAALLFRYVENTTVKNCSFKNLGEGAIALERGSTNDVIKNNIFYDIGSNVIQIARISGYVGRGHPLYHDYIDNAVVPRFNIIDNNHLEKIATVDKGGVGIWIGYAHHTTVQHNLIEDAPYTGINVGWRWDTLATNTHDNLIQYNEIRECMKYLSDGAGIYTIGNQPGTKISNNWIHDIGGGEKLAEGIYADEGSGNIKIIGNYVNRVEDQDYKAHQNLWGSNIIKNNGCKNCVNKLISVTNKVKYSDFPDKEPPQNNIIGLRTLSPINKH